MLITALAHAGAGDRIELEKWIDAADFEPDQKIRAVTDIYNKVGIAEMCNQRISAYYEEGLRLWMKWRWIPL